tara:strand:+ start:276 stop:1868 length:1593 start_codon:yes stop_codon:yes gene_type:complete
LSKFSDDDLVEILRLTYQEKRSSRYISDTYGCGKSTIGDFLRKDTYKDFWLAHEEKPVASGEIHTPDDVRQELSGKRFVFTSAQNNTFVHDKFLKTLEGYCLHNEAELIVGTFHYNKKGFQKGSEEGVWYDPKVRKYVLDESRQIAEGLLWCGELNIVPSAVNPISGLHNYTNRSSGIIPHSKLQLESLPTPKHDTCRMMYTTGSVTQRNYIEMKAGQKARHHHSFSALVVEVDNQGDWFVRQLCAEKLTGNFFDLEYYYTPEGIAFDGEPCCVEGLNFGDIHAAKLDPVVADVSWRSTESIMERLMPSNVFLHDVMDHQNRNHHNIKDPYFRFKMFHNKTESVEDEVYLTASVIEEMTNKGANVVVVESNHDLALSRWLKEQDYKQDPVNAIFFLDLQLATYLALKEGEDFSVFEYACNLLNPEIWDVKFLRTDESYLICGDIECGAHGHNGNNGARGGVAAFQKQGIRVNIGHSHSANIKDGVYQAGVSGKLEMGYNIGGSSWSHSHIVTYSNGKRAIITLRNGKWRG